MKKAARLLVIVFCIPFFCYLFMEKDGIVPKEQPAASTAGFTVKVEEDTGEFTYDPEEILPRIMKAMLSGRGDEAMYRVAAVICRTNLVYTWQQESRPDEIRLTSTGLCSCKRETYHKSEEAEKLKSAAADTVGIVLTYEGKVIPAPFFYLSAGRTRNAMEVYGDDRFSYLQSVDCIDDMQQEEFLTLYDYPKDEFYQKLRMIAGFENVRELSELELEREQTGYVHDIYYKKENMLLPIQDICDSFDLCSPWFEWEERAQSVTIRCKGAGHGVGFDVNYGELLEKQGMDESQILEYFYKDVTLDKRYNAAAKPD